MSRSNHVVGLVLYSLFVLPFSLYAQDLPIFRSDSTVVVVPVTVTGRTGRFVADLAADQFELSDGGSRRAITQFSAERVPVSLGILLDISGSMATDPKARAIDDARWADTRRALELLVQRLNPRDEGTGKGAYVDLVNLESLTADSGGYVEAINDPSEITAATARIFDELQSQYMLAFEPLHADGKYHEITVTMKNRDLRVRARAGYVAPTPSLPVK